jgi:hypothetical protein
MAKNKVAREAKKIQKRLTGTDGKLGPMLMQPRRDDETKDGIPRKSEARPGQVEEAERP